MKFRTLIALSEFDAMFDDAMSHRPFVARRHFLPYTHSHGGTTGPGAGGPSVGDEGTDDAEQEDPSGWRGGTTGPGAGGPSAGDGGTDDTEQEDPSGWRGGTTGPGAGGPSVGGSDAGSGTGSSDSSSGGSSDTVDVFDVLGGPRGGSSGGKGNPEDEDASPRDDQVDVIIDGDEPHPQNTAVTPTEESDDEKKRRTPGTHILADGSRLVVTIDSNGNRQERLYPADSRYKEGYDTGRSILTTTRPDGTTATHYTAGGEFISERKYNNLTPPVRVFEDIIQAGIAKADADASNWAERADRYRELLLQFASDERTADFLLLNQESGEPVLVADWLNNQIKVYEGRHQEHQSQQATREAISAEVSEAVQNALASDRPTTVTLSDGTTVSRDSNGNVSVSDDETSVSYRPDGSTSRVLVWDDDDGGYKEARNNRDRLLAQGAFLKGHVMPQVLEDGTTISRQDMSGDGWADTIKVTRPNDSVEHHRDTDGDGTPDQVAVQGDNGLVVYTLEGWAEEQTRRRVYPGVDEGTVTADNADAAWAVHQATVDKAVTVLREGGTADELTAAAAEIDRIASQWQGSGVTDLDGTLMIDRLAGLAQALSETAAAHTAFTDSYAVATSPLEGGERPIPQLITDIGITIANLDTLMSNTVSPQQKEFVQEETNRLRDVQSRLQSDFNVSGYYAGMELEDSDYAQVSPGLYQPPAGPPLPDSGYYAGLELEDSDYAQVSPGLYQPPGGAQSPDSAYYTGLELEDKDFKQISPGVYLPPAGELSPDSAYYAGLELEDKDFKQVAPDLYQPLPAAVADDGPENWREGVFLHQISQLDGSVESTKGQLDTLRDERELLNQRFRTGDYMHNPEMTLADRRERLSEIETLIDGLRATEGELLSERQGLINKLGWYRGHRDDALLKNQISSAASAGIDITAGLINQVALAETTKANPIGAAQLDFTEFDPTDPTVVAEISAIDLVPVVGTISYAIRASEDGFSKGELVMLGVSALGDVLMFVPGAGWVKAGSAAKKVATTAGQKAGDVGTTVAHTAKNVSIKTGRNLVDYLDKTYLTEAGTVSLHSGLPLMEGYRLGRIHGPKFMRKRPVWSADTASAHVTTISPDDWIPMTQSVKVADDVTPAPDPSNFVRLRTENLPNLEATQRATNPVVATPPPKRIDPLFPSKGQPTTSKPGLTNEEMFRQQQDLIASEYLRVQNLPKINDRSTWLTPSLPQTLPAEGIWPAGLRLPATAIGISPAPATEIAAAPELSPATQPQVRVSTDQAVGIATVPDVEIYTEPELHISSTPEVRVSRSLAERLATDPSVRLITPPFADVATSAGIDPATAPAVKVDTAPALGYETVRPVDIATDLAEVGIGGPPPETVPPPPPTPEEIRRRLPPAEPPLAPEEPLRRRRFSWPEIEAGTEGVTTAPEGEYPRVLAHIEMVQVYHDLDTDLVVSLPLTPPTKPVIIETDDTPPPVHTRYAGHQRVTPRGSNVFSQPVGARKQKASSKRHPWLRNNELQRKKSKTSVTFVGGTHSERIGWGETVTW